MLNYDTLSLKIMLKLNTKEQLFCSADSTHICESSLMLPGSKQEPVNKQALRKSILTANLFASKLNSQIVFYKEIPQDKSLFPIIKTINLAEGGELANIKIKSLNILSLPPQLNRKTKELSITNAGSPYLEIITEEIQCKDRQQLIKFLHELFSKLSFYEIINKFDDFAKIYVSLKKDNKEIFSSKELSKIKDISDIISWHARPYRSYQMPESSHIIEDYNILPFELSKLMVYDVKQELFYNSFDTVYYLLYKKYKFNEESVNIINSNVNYANFILSKEVTDKSKGFKFLTECLIPVLSTVKKTFTNTKLTLPLVLELFDLYNQNLLDKNSCVLVLSELITKQFNIQLFLLRNKIIKKR